MRELSLFSGAGGGLLATHHLLGWSTIGYVEIDPYCQRVLRARIDDGLLDRAPIWTDVRELLESGAAREYRGFADVVTAGFPCQPFSQAGKRLGARDDRNLWPETCSVVSAVRPKRVLLENTVGISKYLPTVRSDLERLGYHVYPRAIVSAASVGAGHIRRRVWIRADSDCPSLRLQPGWSSRAHRKMATESSVVDWWAREPDVDRVDDGVAHRMDRLRALGNGQVPAVAALAWRLLGGG